jgi:hypothetical protein
MKPAIYPAAIALALLFVCAGFSHGAEWSEPVEVRHDLRPCISYKARLEGDLLVVQATLAGGWHTFAMDNQRRADEKLAGKQSLGIDQPTAISVTSGLEVIGPWHQSPPKDFSKPELRWFSWGFENQALFAAKVRRSGAGPARIAVRGQACTESTCKNIEVALSLPLSGSRSGAPDTDLKTLVPVR